jgi:DNA polymerase III subunit chi
MPQIDFYIVPPGDPLLTVCRILEKAYLEKQTVYAHIQTQEEAKTLNDRLWTFRDASFIPHQLVSDITDTTPPISIGFGEQMPEQLANILLNFAPELPEFATQFERVIYIVPDENATWKKQARDYYRDFKSQEWTINHYKL